MSHSGASAESLRRALVAAAMTLSLKAEEIAVSATALERRLDAAPESATGERERIEAFLANIYQYQQYLLWVTERLHLKAAHCTSADSSHCHASDLRAFCLSVCDQIKAQLHYCRSQLGQWPPPSSPSTSDH